MGNTVDDDCTSTFPFDLVSRVWDSYIVEGWKVVYRVMLALLEKAQHELLELDMEDILTYLRDEFPSSVDGKSVMRASLKIPLRQRQIRKYSTEWRTAQGGQRHYEKTLHLAALLPLKKNIIGQGIKYAKKLSY